MLYVLAMSVSMTASMPPIPIWETLSGPLPKAECEAAWDALPWIKQAVAKCVTSEELAQLSRPILGPDPTPFLNYHNQ